MTGVKPAMTGVKPAMTGQGIIRATGGPISADLQKDIIQVQIFLYSDLETCASSRRMRTKRF